MIIAGCGGLALQMLDDLEEQYGNELVFWSEVPSFKSVITKNHKLINSEIEILDEFNRDKRFIIAIGLPANRKNFFDRFTKYGGVCCSLISAKANISRYAEISDGTVILQNVIIEAGVTIGKGCLINTAAVITHECSIGNFTEIAPLSLLAGKVKIGDLTFLGAHSTILPQINIGANVVVGAKSLVTRDIPDNVKVMGSPAKPYSK